MDAKKRLLIEKIIEDCISENLRRYDVASSKRAREEGAKLGAERRDEEERIAKLPPENRWTPSSIRGYNSREWIHFAANILRPAAIAFIEELSGKVREQSTSAKAGEMFGAGVDEMLRELDSKYVRAFDRERLFLMDGKPRQLPPYWASERPDIERKVEIEALKFVGASSVAELVSNATPAQKRDKPFADEAAKLLRDGKEGDVAKAIRKVRPHRPEMLEESVDRAIRTCFDLHYDKNGQPLPK